ncbi:comG operon protein 4 [Listeria floridensis FSL S10-1187]|uniref:ComG operon protein 4 n=1 Tax=Listeria floridensis FSL S10-1187 TaxID=1265817 RepID=A0ABP3AXV0_9LIST|nr:competence type IV pilus minor pilin ComGD [Listeria floridensis]EUJ31768.1 comG operon protein 4 [Listeria floridensis FSL S10-1187]
MKNRRINRNGFTLIEMLIVLAIFMILISLSIKPAFQALQHIEKKQFLQVIKADIFLAQTRALVTNQPITLTFEEDRLLIQEKGDQKTQDLYPKTLKLKQKEQFSFLGKSGHINRFTTVFFKGQSRSYKLIFQIGKGRFRFEEN